MHTVRLTYSLFLFLVSIVTCKTKGLPATVVPACHASPAFCRPFRRPILSTTVNGSQLIRSLIVLTDTCMQLSPSSNARRLFTGLVRPRLHGLTPSALAAECNLLFVSVLGWNRILVEPMILEADSRLNLRSRLLLFCADSTSGRYHENERGFSV